MQPKIEQKSQPAHVEPARIEDPKKLAESNRERVPLTIRELKKQLGANMTDCLAPRNASESTWAKAMEKLKQHFADCMKYCTKDDIAILQAAFMTKPLNPEKIHEAIEKLSKKEAKKEACAMVAIFAKHPDLAECAGNFYKQQFASTSTINNYMSQFCDVSTIMPNDAAIK